MRLVIIIAIISLISILPITGEVFPSAPENVAIGLNDNIDTISDSLSMWGDTIDPRVDALFKNAISYNNARDFEKAQQLFNYTIFYCANNHIPLHIDQFDNILLRRAYALSDSERMPFALELYDYRLDVLEDRNSWEEKLPTGLSILRDKGIDTIEILEGMCHQDRSIAKLILNDFPGAWDDVQKAVDLFSKNDRLYNVIDTYHGYIQDAAGLEKWEYVLTAWSDFEKYFASGKRAITKESFPKIIDILRENMLANVNLRKYESAMDASNQLIKLEHDIGYNDSKTKVDYETNDTLKKGLKKLIELNNTNPTQ